MKYIPYASGEKIRIVFIYQVASFWPSWDSFLNCCLRDAKFDAVVLLLREHGIEKQQMKTAESFIKLLGIPYTDFDEFDMDAFRPHYAVFQTPYELDHRGGNIDSWSAALRSKGIRIVYIPYGIEIADTKSAMFAHFGTTVIINCYRLYTLSEAMREEYVKHCSNAGAVRAMGLPKFDGLVKKENFSLPAHVRERVGDRRIVLWKVHFPKNIVENGVMHRVSPELDEYLSFMNEIDQNKDLFFVFGPHPNFGEAGDLEEKKKSRILLEELGEKENVWVDRTDDYRNSLISADAIMVDRSSLMVEAAAIGVPVMYIYNKEYDEPLTAPIRRLIDSYYQGTTCDDMNEFIEMFKTDDDPKKEERERTTREIIPYLDGNCGVRIAEDLAKALVTDQETEVPEYDIKGKRLIIWGTGKVAKELYYVLRFAENLGLIQVLSYVDSDKNKIGTVFQNKKVESLDRALSGGFDYLIIASEIYYNDMYWEALDKGIPEEKIVNFDRFLVKLMEITGETNG